MHVDTALDLGSNHQHGSNRRRQVQYLIQLQEWEIIGKNKSAFIKQEFSMNSNDIWKMSSKH